MNKSELLAALEESREKFMEAIEGLSEEDMLRPEMAGEWTLKDLLAHLTMWEAELVKLLWQVHQGIKPTSIQFSNVEVDQQNAHWYQQNKDRPLEQVLSDFHGVRPQTMRRVESFLDRDLNNPKRYDWLDGTPLWQWIATDTFEHEAEHTAQVQAWRQAQGL